MAQKVWIHIVASWLLCGAGFPSMGQQDTTASSLYLFTLEDLEKNQVQVTTASKREESIEDAPAVISVLTKEEIRRSGANSLFELFDRLPSVYAFGSVFHPDNQISIRGDNTVHYSSHVLLLLNGRPLRESLQAGTYMAINHQIPLDIIQRIEFVRGPGSVLYGSNAYTGVVNIITRSNQEGSALWADARAGGFGRQQLALGGRLGGGAMQAQAGIQAMTDDGWEFTASDEQADILPSGQVDRNDRNTRTIPMEREGLGAYADVKAGGFTATAYYGLNEQRSMYFTGLWIPNQVIEGNDTIPGFLQYRSRSSWLFADLSYQKQLSPSWNTSISLTANRFALEEFSEPSTDDIARGEAFDQILEWTNYFNINKGLTLIAGGLLNRNTGRQVNPERRLLDDGSVESFDIYNLNLSPNPTPYPLIPEYDELLWAGYMQADLQLQDYGLGTPLKLTAAAQVNKVPEQPLDIVPRFALIYNWSPLIGVKLLYGQAFRAASANERFVDFSPIIEGNPALKPEKMRALEGVVYYNSLNNRLKLQATVFTTQQRNLVFRFIDQYLNSGSRVSTGLELEASYRVSDRWGVQFSSTYQRVRDELPAYTIGVDTRDESNQNGLDSTSISVEQLTGMPKFMLKLGGYAQLTEGVKFSGFLTYFGSASLPSREIGGDASNVLPKPVNPEVRPVGLLTAKLEAALGKVTQIKALSNVELSVYGQNLLNEQVMMPEYTRQIINALPARGGRTVFVSLRYRID